MARRHPPVEENLCMVQPSHVTVSSSKKEVRMEEGFTFAMPEEIKEEFRKSFRKACNLDDDSLEK